MNGVGLLVTIAWILCIILVILPTLAQPRPPRQPTRKPVDDIEYLTEIWKLEDTTAESYTELIAYLRDGVKIDEVCEIPVTTSESPIIAKEFILVEITSLTNKKITLAFGSWTVNYVGFMDELDGVTRANFVEEYFDELKESRLFSNAKIKSKLPHRGTFAELEEVAELYRRELPLGVSLLSYLLDTIYGADYNGTDKPVDVELDLAKFALIAIQMTAEATRFKYIEDEVRDLGLEEEYFLPNDGTFIALEDDWGMISELIYSTIGNDTDCEIPVKVPDYPWDDIKPLMGLLRYRNGSDDDQLALEGLKNDAHASL